MTKERCESIVALCLPYTALWEGFRALPYQDKYGRWTIGYGWSPKAFPTADAILDAAYAATGVPDRQGVNNISKDRALSLLRQTLTQYYNSVDSALHDQQAWNCANDDEQAGMLDMVYRRGLSKFLTGHTWRAFKEGGLAEVNKVIPPIAATFSTGIKNRTLNELALMNGVAKLPRAP